MNTKSYLPCIIAGAAGAIVASIIPFLIAPSKAETKLLPFQGRLTKADGGSVGDGARVVEFKMYDAPTGGNVKWAGEVHKLSVNGGLVNTMLGSKASLGEVDFSTPTFLQITIDADGAGHIDAADPPLLPRQSVVPAVYATVAGGIQYVVPEVPASGGNPAVPARLRSAGWEAVFNDGNPETGFVLGQKIAGGSITGTQIAADAVTSTHVNAQAISFEELAESVREYLIPAGTIIAFGGTPPPTGWLPCDGQSYSEETYPKLAAILKATWGTNGVGTFKVPDLRGRIPVGAGKGPGLSERLIGAAFGSETFTLTSAQLPPHHHQVFGNNSANAALSASNSPSFAVGIASGLIPNTNFEYIIVGDSGEPTLGKTSSAGSGSPVPYMPPSAAILYIIKH